MRRILLAICVGIFLFSGCATQYIEILEPDIIMHNRELDFRVEPGDTLKVMSSKTCIGGRGICYEVKDLKTDKRGYVTKKRMEERHRIYTESK